MNPLRLLLALPVLMAPCALFAGIDSVQRLRAEPVQHGRVDFQIMLRSEWQDPYDPRQVALDLELVSPSGKKLLVPAFHLTGASGGLSEWQLRFTPGEAGDYKGSFQLKEKEGSPQSVPVRFTVAPKAGKGFLKASDTWGFRYEDGTPFRGIGENICWESRATDDSKFFKQLHESPRYNYEYMLGSLAASGGNYYRTWMCSWNLPLQWKAIDNTRRYVSDGSSFNASAARRMDELVTLSENLNLHMMLCIDTAGSYLGGDWEKNIYNKKNGGPADSPLEFFQSKEARELYKHRLRYLIARWGYSHAIGAWEFFNEIDNLMYGVKPTLPDELITDWHKEMSEYLRQADPYGHLITTSVSHREVKGLWSLASMDFDQHHVYKRTEDIPNILQKTVSATKRPHVIGEFSYEWDWLKDFREFAPEMDRDYVHGLWLGLFSETPILPMSWWWEFFDSRDMTRHMAPVRVVLDEMLKQGKGSFTKLEASIKGEGLKVVAVRCGDSTYAYVWSNTGAEAGQLSLPRSSAKDQILSRLNQENGTWIEQGRFQTEASLPLPALAKGAWVVLRLSTP